MKRNPLTGEFCHRMITPDLYRPDQRRDERAASRKRIEANIRDLFPLRILPNERKTVSTMGGA